MLGLDTLEERGDADLIRETLELLETMAEIPTLRSEDMARCFEHNEKYSGLALPHILILVFLVNHRFAEVVALSEEAIKRSYAYTQPYKLKAMALVGLERLEEALACCEQWIAREPNSASAYETLSWVLSLLQRDQEAQEALARAAPVHDKQGQEHLKEQQYQEALASFERSALCDPGSAYAPLGKGLALRALHRDPEALTAFTQALALDPTMVAASQQRGEVLLDLKRYNEALTAFDYALRLNSSDQMIHLGRCEALLALHRFEEALYATDFALRLYPYELRAYTLRLRVLYALKRPEEALIRRCA